MAQDSTHLLWIDLEMTGLDPNRERILEIATIVTDSALNVLAEGPELVIRQAPEVLAAMDEWNTEQHGGSGLVARVLSSTCSETEAEERTLEFARRHVPPRTSPCVETASVWTADSCTAICRGSNGTSTIATST